jgi:two-component system chemotaxis sensor kinase CheA
MTSVSQSTDPVKRSPVREAKGFVSVASRLAVVIFALVVAVSALVAFELTRREEEHFIESKRLAGTMLTELLSASIAPALDFADADAVRASLGMLAKNRDVVDALVWSLDAREPLGRLRSGGDSSWGAGASRAPSVVVAADHIDIARAVKSPVGKALGSVLVRVSLADERSAFVATRKRIFWLAFVLSALVAALLIGVVRRTIISPLEALERAARRLSRGELTEVANLRADEIGSLGYAFNHMGRAIREREERIYSVNTRLQGLLDTMRQAIVVFDGDGRLERERSRFAEQLFGNDSDADSNIVDLLYPAEHAPDVEREAFRAWLGVAGAVPRERFDELAELAPKEARLQRAGGDDRLLELEFRAAAGATEGRIMLLATDVTSQRRLERSAETREREHRKQLTAMRRLLAGGGQVFVRFLTSARERLGRAESSLGSSGSFGADAVENAFRFVHTLRAESRSFDLKGVEELTLGLELELAGARHAPPGSALLVSACQRLRAGYRALATLLDEAEALFVESSPIGRRVLEQVTVSRGDVEELVKRCGTRTDDLGRLVSRLAARPFGELTSTLSDDASRWATKAQKRTEVVLEGREILVPARVAERLSGVLAHLVRNAIAHGIELPERRLELGKPEIGRIELSCREAGQGVEIRVSDDGMGFDPGMFGADDGEAAFAAGVSTRTTPDELGGFGVGLGAVRDELKEIGYLVKLQSVSGRGASVLMGPAGVALERAWSTSPSSS